MLRHTFHWLLLGIFLLIWCSPAAASEGQPKKRPNIIYIMSDDHACAAVGCYDQWLSKYAPTPNIDKLAKQGMRFTQYAVTNSICTPSRAAILTGQYSHKNGVYTLSDPLEPKRDHFIKRLLAALYQTAIIGKWHLLADPVGFTYWNILPGQGRYIDPIMRAKDEKEKVYKGYSTDVITDLSLKWLDQRDKTKPFVLCVHYKAPHRPWDPAPRFEGKFKDVKFPEPPTLLDDFKDRSQAAVNAKMRIGDDNSMRDLGVEPPPGLGKEELRRWAFQIFLQRYLSCVAAVDENVGRILDYLEKNGLTEDTIVIYTSDQGFFLGEHGWFDKRFMYEESLLAPLIIRYPGPIKPGTVNDALILNIDHAPTLLDLAGVAPMPGVQGRSYKTLLEGNAPNDWRTSMYYRYWMHGADHNVPAHYGLRNQQFTLVYYYGDGLGMKGTQKFKNTTPEWELFDRKNDPHMTNNVYNAAQYQAVVQELTKELHRLKKEVGDDK
jgi:arylsulfatase A-like enzyme